MDTKNFTTDTQVVWKGWLERVLTLEREQMFGWTDDQICRFLHDNASAGVSLVEVREFYEGYPYPVNLSVGYYTPPKPFKEAFFRSEAEASRKKANKKYNKFNIQKIGKTADLVVE